MKFATIINLKTFAVAAVAALGLSSCSNAPNSPGYEYMPDMYRSPSLEYYSTHILNGDTLMTAKQPVAGTIARGHMPAIPPGMDYEKAGLYLKNPIPNSDAVLKDAEVLYSKFCVHCHGDAGHGDGKVGLKLPGAPPAYDGTLKNLPEGKIFYSITHGKGMMGSHASQLSAEERWKLVHYVQKLQGPKAAADSAAAKAPVVVAELKKEEKK
ncbi:MAG TPA: cytochrome c [Bacteroidia bacterium]|jgi:mono/diheme cytochrome c family protein|nr:cytochrome c [Bacteroidia bacterium]